MRVGIEGWMRQHGPVVVALSGGVDSSVVAAAAAVVWGNAAVAVTGRSPSLPGPELEAIRRLCQGIGLPHDCVETHELDRADYVANSPERCFACKDELFSMVRTWAQQRGIETVVDGTHRGDLEGHRPGRRAAALYRIRSPLLELGLDKELVREVARAYGLAMADRPASPCLSSRIAYGLPVTVARLTAIEQAEHYLGGLGFTQCRVRHHGSIARIEVPASSIGRLAQHARAVAERLRELGFIYVTLDLVGLRSGSLLEEVAAQDQQITS